MKIIYDHQVFSWQKYGGISRYFYEIITKISEDNSLDIDLFHGFYANKYGLEQKKDAYNNYFGYNRPNIPKTGRIFNLLNNIGLRLFSEGKYDIYHPTYYNNYKTLESYNLVLTVYDMIHEIFPNEFPNNFIRQKKKILINKADGIIAISHNTKKDLINILGIDEEKIRVIYLGNSLKYVVAEDKIVKEPYILFVGNRSGYKNFKIVIKSFAYSRLKKNFKLVCFGGGAFSTEEKLELVKFNIQDKVELFLGNDKMLANLYTYAELFIYPSQYEGFGIPPLEAMYYGTPVLAARTSSIPEVVGDAGIYFNPISEEDLSDKMIKLLTNTELQLDLREKGFIQEKNFSWDRCAKETIDFYKQINRMRI